MNKLLSTIIILSSVVTVSCSKDYDMMMENDSVEESPFVGIIDNDTRVHFEKDGGVYKVAWDAGDQIALRSSGNVAVGCYESEKSGTVSKFNFVSGRNVSTGNAHYFSVYPYSYFLGFNVEGAKYERKGNYSTGYYYSLISPADTTFWLNLPSLLPYKAGSPGILPMIASDNSSNLHFKNICSVVKVRLKSNDESVMLRKVELRTQADVIAGEIKLKKNCDTLSVRNLHGSKTVSVYSDDGILVGSDYIDFYFPILPGEITNSVTILLYSTNGKIKSYSADGLPGLEVSKMYPVTLSFYASDFQEKKAQLESGSVVNERLKGLVDNNVSKVKHIVFTPLSSTPSGEYVTIHAVDKPIYAEYSSVDSTIHITTDMAIFYLKDDAVNMFKGFSSLEDIRFDALEAASTNMKNFTSMFSGCSSLQSVDFSNCVISNVQSMTSMFSDCSKLRNVNFGDHFETSKLTSISSCFSNCKSLENINFGAKFSTAKVTTMGFCFSNCSSLRQLNLSTFSSPALSDVEKMFYGCSLLGDLNLGKDFLATTASSCTWVSCFNKMAELLTESGSCKITCSQSAKNKIVANASSAKITPSDAKYEWNIIE